MEVVNLLDALEGRVASLLEEVARLRLASTEAEHLRAENQTLRQALEDERQTREATAARIGSIMERLDRQLNTAETPDHAQG